MPDGSNVLPDLIDAANVTPIDPAPDAGIDDTAPAGSGERPDGGAAGGGTNPAEPPRLGADALREALHLPSSSIVEGWSDEAMSRTYPVAITPKNRTIQTTKDRWQHALLPAHGVLHAFGQHLEGRKDGPAITGGSLTGGKRVKQAVKEMSLLLLDVETGQTIEEVIANIREQELDAIITSTHSHLKTESLWSKDAVMRHSFGREERKPGREHVVSFLRDVKHIRAEILDSLKIVGEEQTEEGIKIRVCHLPIPRMRIVIPLLNPFVFASRPGCHSHAAAMAEWPERYAGACELLKVEYDHSCTDPSRAMNGPRHAPGAPWEVHILRGKPLDIDRVQRVSKGSQRRGPTNVFMDAAAEIGIGETYQTRGLGRFFAERNGRFDIVQFFQDNDPDGNRGPMASGGGMVWQCPNDCNHSNAGDPDDKGCIVISAADSTSTYAVARCMHDACSDLKTPHFVDLLCQNVGIEDAKELEEWCFEVEGDEEKEEEKPATPRAPEKARPYNAIPKAKHCGEYADDLDWMSERHAIIRNGTGVYAMDYPGEGDDVLPQTLTIPAFNNFYAHKKIVYHKKDGATGMKALTKEWLEDERTKRFAGIAFEPAKDVGDRYNAWRGFNVAAIQGDWSILRGHIKDTICAGNQEHFDWTMTWMAQIVQQPGRKMSSAVVVRGKKGSGKSTVFEYLQKALAPYCIEVSSKDQITGHFNAHMWGRLLIVAEEAFWGGDREGGNQLKTLISSSRGVIERKGQDVIKATNYHRLAMITNEKWVVPSDLNDDERRYFVLDCLPTRIGDKMFFKKLRAQMESGGLEAMVHELQHWQPPGGDWDVLYHPPVTEALRDQQRQSAKPLEVFWLEAASSGGFYSSSDFVESHGWEMDAVTEVPIRVVKDHVEQFIRTHGRARLTHEAIFQAGVDTLGPELIRQRHPKQVGKMPRPEKEYVLQPLGKVLQKLRRTGKLREEDADPE